MTQRGIQSQPLSPQEVAYMRVWASMPDRMEWWHHERLRALAEQLGVKP